MKSISRTRAPLFIGLVVSLALAACDRPVQQPGADITDTMDTMDTLVSAEWLSQHLDDSDLVVIDCTVIVQPNEDGTVQTISGRSGYEKGHIPGAGFADLKGALADGDSPLDFAMPTPAQFAAAMGALGVGNDTRVVLYDNYNGVWASRVWWMLRWIGFDNAALLDGALTAWTGAGHPLSTEPANRSAKQLSIRLRPELIADRGEVHASLGDGSVKLIDAMNEAHYRGEMSMYARPGHIPGATNLPTTELFDETGRFRSDDELAMIMGGDRDARTITYCGGGIAASADAFALHRLGFTNIAVYTASLQEWAADPALPLETD